MRKVQIQRLHLLHTSSWANGQILFRLHSALFGYARGDQRLVAQYKLHFFRNVVDLSYSLLYKLKYFWSCRSYDASASHNVNCIGLSTELSCFDGFFLVLMLDFYYLLVDSFEWYLVFNCGADFEVRRQSPLMQIN